MSDLDLKHLQAQFQNYVRFLDDAVVSSVVSSERVSAKTRLEIYRYAYFARFKECLHSDFPAVEFALGEDLFSQLSDDYAVRYPSHYRSINDFGQHFSEYLSHPNALFGDNDQGAKQFSHREFIVELSQFEWALVRAFNASNVTHTVQLQELAQLPAEAWPGLCFKFHPSVQVLPQHWNVNAFWNSVKPWLEGDDDTAAEPQNQNITKPQRAAQIQHSLVWRQGLITGFRSLANQEFLVLQSALDGESFAMICDKINAELDAPEQTPVIAAGYLKTWVSGDMLVELRY